MLFRSLVRTVDSERYSGNLLYQKLRDTKPEYGSNRHIHVKLAGGEIAITNIHVGSLGDIITYPIDIDTDQNISKERLLNALLQELSSNGFCDYEESDFWNEMTNLQKAKIIR